jgi:hypothetical protein
MLHHDNAPAHASLLICEFFMKHEMTVVPQPSCSPDLAPADFFLFPELKFLLKGHRFQMIEEIAGGTKHTQSSARHLMTN